MSTESYDGTPCKNCICVPVCLNKSIAALLRDCDVVDLWILGGPHTKSKDGVEGRDEEITVLNKTIRVQTRGKLRTVYEGEWTFNVEMSHDYKKYFEVWSETINQWNKGSVVS